MPRVEHHLVQQHALGIPLVPHAIHSDAVCLDRLDAEKLALEQQRQASHCLTARGVGSCLVQHDKRNENRHANLSWISSTSSYTMTRKRRNYVGLIQYLQQAKTFARFVYPSFLQPGRMATERVGSNAVPDCHDPRFCLLYFLYFLFAFSGGLGAECTSQQAIFALPGLHRLASMYSELQASNPTHRSRARQQKACRVRISYRARG